jgi:hypothetical protein
MAQRFAASPSILSFMAESPNYGQLSSTSAMERAKNEAANLIGNARMHGAGITGSANREIAKYRGKAGLAQDRADGYAAMMGGLADGASSIIGGIGSMPSGGAGGTVSGYGMNSFGDYTDLYSASPDMSGFPTSFSGTKFSGFPTSRGIA